MQTLIDLTPWAPASLHLRPSPADLTAPTKYRPAVNWTGKRPKPTR